MRPMCGGERTTGQLGLVGTRTELAINDVEAKGTPVQQCRLGHVIELDPQAQRQLMAAVDNRLIAQRVGDRLTVKLGRARQQAVGFQRNGRRRLECARDVAATRCAVVENGHGGGIEAAVARLCSRLRIATINVEHVLVAAGQHRGHLHPQHGQLVDAIEALDAELQRRLVIAGHHAQIGAVFLRRREIEVSRMQAHGHGDIADRLLGLEALGRRVERDLGALRPVAVPPGGVRSARQGGGGEDHGDECFAHSV